MRTLLFVLLAFAAFTSTAVAMEVPKDAEMLVNRLASEWRVTPELALIRLVFIGAKAVTNADAQAALQQLDKAADRALTAEQKKIADKAAAAKAEKAKGDAPTVKGGAKVEPFVDSGPRVLPALENN